MGAQWELASGLRILHSGRSTKPDREAVSSQQVDRRSGCSATRFCANWQLLALNEAPRRRPVSQVSRAALLRRRLQGHNVVEATRTTGQHCPPAAHLLSPAPDSAPVPPPALRCRGAGSRGSGGARRTFPPRITALLLAAALVAAWMFSSKRAAQAGSGTQVRAPSPPPRAALNEVAAARDAGGTLAVGTMVVAASENRVDAGAPAVVKLVGTGPAHTAAAQQPGLFASLPVRAAALARMAARLARRRNSLALSPPAAAATLPSLVHQHSSLGGGGSGSRGRAASVSGGDLGAGAVASSGGRAEAPAPQGQVEQEECRPSLIVVLTSHKTGTAQARCWRGAGMPQAEPSLSQSAALSMPHVGPSRPGASDGCFPASGPRPAALCLSTHCLPSTLLQVHHRDAGAAISDAGRRTPRPPPAPPPRRRRVRSRAAADAAQRRGGRQRCAAAPGAALPRPCCTLQICFLRVQLGWQRLSQISQLSPLLASTPCPHVLPVQAACTALPSSSTPRGTTCRGWRMRPAPARCPAPARASRSGACPPRQEPSTSPGAAPRWCRCEAWGEPGQHPLSAQSAACTSWWVASSLAAGCVRRGHLWPMAKSGPRHPLQVIRNPIDAVLSAYEYHTQVLQLLHL